MNVPRLVIAGLSGDSGKTLVSLSLLSALRERGIAASVFKKGPDYIDAAWLTWAAGVPCRNLDTYMVAPAPLLDAFTTGAAESDIAIVEGNRGLFDGSDATGTHSTAALAKLLGAPVILVVNCTKTTRTLAAIINGCTAFDRDLRIAGVVLNRVAGKRHETVIRESIETYCRLPVLGAIPRYRDDAGLIPGRHLGLVTPSEFESGGQLASRLREIAARHLDLERLSEAARQVSPLRVPDTAVRPTAERARVRVGYFKDTVFTFYYPENLEALANGGAELVPVSSLDDTALPVLDALYIGGGFPEVHADRLVRNRSLMQSVRQASEAGLPIYAECGGLIYLSRSIACGEHRYAMAGVFDLDLRIESQPVGHGYVAVRIDQPCPFFPVGTEIRGHEFHYSGPVTTLPASSMCMAVERGVGVANGRDGLVKRNTLACYTHLHAGGVASWAQAVVRRAEEFRANHQADRVPLADSGTNNLRRAADTRKTRSERPRRDMAMVAWQ